MLDLKLIRAEPDRVRAALARRGEGDAVDRVLELDGRRRELLPRLEELRSRQNKASDEIGARKRAGEDADAAISAMRAVADEAKSLGAELSGVEEELDAALAVLPNPPEESAADEDEVLREVGEGGAAGKDHLELLGDLVDLS